MNNWKNICIDETFTILQAIKNITDTSARFAVVVSPIGKLLGTISDGDIRKALLSGLTLEDSVVKVMNANPLVASANTSNIELREIMSRNNFTHIPIIDSEDKIIKILSLQEVQSAEPIKENAVILMVGGLGSRLGELTANCPKSMLKLGDKPLLEIMIENLKDSGFYNFFLSVNYKSEMIESYFGNGSQFDVKIDYIREKERMGTAGSLSLFGPINDLPVIIMNGDILTKINFSSLLDFHTSNGLDACVCTKRHDYQIPFGVLNLEDDLVLKIDEKPVYSALVNAGIYSMDPKLLSLIPKDVFFDMPTLLGKIIDEKYRIGAFQVQDYWLDIGRHADFHQAVIDYRNKLKK